MTLKAKLDAKTIVSVLCSNEEWAEAIGASKGNEHRLRTLCCDQPAYASHSPLNLRYFAHKPGSDRCPSAAETDEHAFLKAKAAQTVNSIPEWSADVEVSGDGWRADVLAVRKSIKVAIEIQLSGQAKRETSERNSKFVSSDVTPFWLKGVRNHQNDFGAGLQAPVHGKTAPEKVESVRAAVTDLLTKIERQANLANGLGRLLKRFPSWNYKLHKQGSIPACFELTHLDGRRQQILLAEMGEGLLPVSFKPTKGYQLGEDQFAGAIIQLRINGRHLKGYESSSFQINDKYIDQSLNDHLGPILYGQKRWQGKKHRELIPGAFIHYLDDCDSCGTLFLRIPYAVIGHPKYPVSFRPEILPWDFSQPDKLIPFFETLAASMNLPLAITTFESSIWQPSKLEQCCPRCGAPAPPQLITEDEAIANWENNRAHFKRTISLPNAGWVRPTEWEVRQVPTGTWDALLNQKRSLRQTTRDEAKRKHELREAKRKQELQELNKKNEDERIQRAADLEHRRKEDARLANEAAQAKINEQRTKRELKLRDEATKTIKDPYERQLWLNTANSGLSKRYDLPAPRPIELAAESEEGLTLALNHLKKVYRKK